MKIKFVIISIIISTLYSCTKDKTEPEVINDSTTKKGILVFDTFDEYISTINKTLSMSPVELQHFEKTFDYTSFGRKCEEIYFSINIDKLKSYDELEKIVNENNKYLKLVKNDNNEIILEHHLFNHPERFVINNDCMFQVEETAFKVFQNHYAFTSIQNADKLVKLNEEDLFSKGIDPNITIIINEHIINTKDFSKSCGAGEITKRYPENVTEEDEIGTTSERIKLVIGAHQPDCLSPYELEAKARNYFLVRPYKKTLGVWFWVECYISADINIALDYYTLEGWTRYISKQNYPSRLARKIEGEIVRNSGLQCSTNLQVHFGGYDCWASSNRVKWKKAILKCGDLLY